MEAVYIVHTRESIRMNENVYKIGRTAQVYTKRLSGYPKGSILKIQKSIMNSKDVEYKMIQRFKQRFHQRTDMGYEYFEGKYYDLEVEFLYVVNSCDPNSPQNSQTDDNKLQCKKCKRHFKKLKYLKAHANICQGVEPLTCNVCLHKFSHSSSKSRHKNRGNCIPTSNDDVSTSRPVSEMIHNETLNIPKK
jgi:hypothetical protein